MSHKHHKHQSNNQNEYEYEDTYELHDEEDDHQPIHLPVRKHQQRCTQIKCESQDQISFCVPLSFDQELVMGSTAGVLIPLSTIATNLDNIRGVLKLKFNSNLSKIAYALYVFNATENDNRIVGAHLHLGGANTNGPVVVDLFGGPARNVNGLLVKGLIDNRSIEPLGMEDLPAINTVASLYQAIREGALYVNVHSQQFPDGVVRGQIYLKNSYVSSEM